MSKHWPVINASETAGGHVTDPGSLVKVSAVVRLSGAALESAALKVTGRAQKGSGIASVFV